MIKISKKQAERVKVIKDYAKGQEDFNFIQLGYDFANYYPERWASTVEGIPALDIIASTSSEEMTQIERAYYEGYEIEPDWKFDIGDIVYLAPTLAAPRSLWYVESRIDACGKAHYLLCGDYDLKAHAYCRPGSPPYMEVSEEKLRLIQKKSEWEQAVVPKKKIKPLMHPRCGHGSKAQY
ncbi:hypothetical protein [Listeria booriae]|uniref:hypothetical protein n=1 Tax=Listeria booriae TaxID=1552123 RepID=UPI001623B0C3|nr:hypothetical protein [Listeria booriae]MBC2174760.1 hypothetical protein [Listeria booriae]